MKRLKFSDALMPLVLDRSKTITWRINDDKDIRAGDALILCKSDGSEFGKASVVWTKVTSFANLTREDKEGHEKFASEKEMYETYAKYYGIEVGPTTNVKVVKYRLV